MVDILGFECSYNESVKSRDRAYYYYLVNFIISKNPEFDLGETLNFSPLHCHIMEFLAFGIKDAPS